MSRLDEPNSAIRTKKDLKVRTRLMAVRVVLEPGHSTENIATVFGVTARRMRKWVLAVQEGRPQRTARQTKIRQAQGRPGRQHTAGCCRATENQPNSQGAAGKDRAHIPNHGVVSLLDHVVRSKEIYHPSIPAPPYCGYAPIWQELKCKKHRPDAVHFWLCLCCLQTARQQRNCSGWCGGTAGCFAPTTG